MALLALTLEAAFPISTLMTGLTTQTYGTNLPFLTAALF